MRTLVFTGFIFCMGIAAHAQPNITAAEYFFDADPGVGNATPFTISAGTTIDINNLNVSTASLALGWHTLCIRVRDANNTWGFYECRRIFIREPVNVVVPPVYPITQGEVFFNTDNGPGTGIPITASGNDVDISNASWANTLPVGWHTVHIRMKNQDNVWGFYESRKIFIRGAPDPAPSVSPIVELEYFVDTDPGVGLSSRKITVSSLHLVDMVNEPLDVGTQSLGTHRIYIRGKNAAGEWGGSEAADFSVTAACPILNAPGATGVARCDPGSVTLTATGASGGETYRWYTTSGTLTPSFTGNPFVTPSLSANTTFYVAIYNATTFCESGRTPVTASISGIAKPVLNINGLLQVCEGTTQLLSAPPGYSSYTWSNGLTTQQITVATTGSYSVVVNNGVCSSPASDAFVFTVNSRPSKPTITGTNGGSLCGVGSITLSGPAGLPGYAWSSGQTTQNISVSVVGSFALTVTNAAGCQSVVSDPFVVQSGVLNQPVITVTGNTALCPGNTVQLSAPGGYSNYVWSNGATTANITANADGNYTVKVGNGTCESPVSTAVAVTMLTIPSKPAVQITGSTSLCTGGFVVLTAPVGFNNYLWSNGETTRQIVVASSGDFSVQTGNASYCMSVASDVVAVTTTGQSCGGSGGQLPPSAPTVVNGLHCGPGEVILSATGAASGLEYRWYDVATGGVLLSSVASFTTPTITQTTDFFAAVFDPVTLQESARVKVTATIVTLSKPGLSPQGIVAICIGSSIMLSAPTGSTAYRWSKDGAIMPNQTQQVSVTLAGNYTVETGDGNCFSAPSDAVMVLVDTQPAKPSVSGSNSICGTGSVTLTSSAATRYLWSTNETTSTVSVSAGTYSVTVFDGACSATSDPFTVNITTIPSKPVITTAGRDFICAGSFVALSAPAGCANYRWSDGSTGQTLLIDQPGLYAVQIGNSASCLSERSNPVAVRIGAVAECGVIPSPTNRPPEIQPFSFGVQIQSEARHPVETLLNDEEGHLDMTSVRIIDGPASQGKASGGKVYLDGEYNVVLDYRGVNFAGKEYFTLQACDAEGLCSQQQMVVDVVGEVMIFNGVTPDGDGINDFMLIQFIDIINGAKKNKVTIMNRSGDVVFDIEDYDNKDRVFAGLDNNGGELPGGTYFFRVVLETGESHVGFMTLKR